MRGFDVIAAISALIGALVCASCIIYKESHVPALNFTSPVNNTELIDDESKYKNSEVKEILSEMDSIHFMEENGRVLSPNDILNKKIKVETLAEDADFLYTTKYSRNFNPIPRIITYINLSSESNGGYSLYANAYRGVDCLGVGFNPKFQNEKPVSKEQCIGSLKKTINAESIEQKEKMKAFDALKGKLWKTDYKVVLEKAKSRDLEMHWVHSNPDNSCQMQADYKNVSQDYINKSFKNENDCLSNVKKLNDERINNAFIINDRNNMASGMMFFGSLLFIPLFIRAIIILFKLVSGLWFRFLKSSTDAINSSEKKIKIDADINISNKNKDGKP